MAIILVLLPIKHPLHAILSSFRHFLPSIYFPALLVKPISKFLSKLNLYLYLQVPPSHFALRFCPWSGTYYCQISHFFRYPSFAPKHTFFLSCTFPCSLKHIFLWPFFSKKYVCLNIFRISPGPNVTYVGWYNWDWYIYIIYTFIVLSLPVKPLFHTYIFQISTPPLSPGPFLPPPLYRAPPPPTFRHASPLSPSPCWLRVRVH